MRYKRKSPISYRPLDSTSDTAPLTSTSAIIPPEPASHRYQKYNRYLFEINKLRTGRGYMSIHLDRYYEPLHPVLLPDHLSGVRVHDSPPPTLTAGSVLAVQQLSALNAIYSGAHNSAAIRNDNNGNNNNNNDTDKDNTNRNRRDMAAAATLQGGLSMDMFRDPSSASAASVESVRIKEEDRRSPPEVEMDPRGTLETVRTFIIVI